MENQPPQEIKLKPTLIFIYQHLLPKHLPAGGSAQIYSKYFTSKFSYSKKKNLPAGGSAQIFSKYFTSKNFQNPKSTFPLQLSQAFQLPSNTKPNYYLNNITLNLIDSTPTSVDSLKVPIVLLQATANYVTHINHNPSTLT